MQEDLYGGDIYGSASMQMMGSHQAVHNQASVSVTNMSKCIILTGNLPSFTNHHSSGRMSCRVGQEDKVTSPPRPKTKAVMTHKGSLDRHKSLWDDGSSPWQTSSPAQVAGLMQRL